MKDDHNIDRLFQESFKNFEVEAPKNAWQNIENQLQSQRKPVIPLWQKLTATAAVVAIMLVAGYQLLTDTNNTNNTNSVVDTPQQNLNLNTNTPDTEFILPVDENNDDNRNEEIVLKEDIKSDTKTTPNQNNLLIASEDKEAKTTTAKDPNHQNTKSTFDTDYAQTTQNEPNEALILNSKSFDNKPNFFEAPELSLTNEISGKSSTLKSLVEVAHQIYEDKNTKIADAKEKSWFVKPQISPTFYGNLGSGSSIDQNFSQNSSSGDVNVSYGVNVAYQVNDKIKLRSGINHVNLNYSTNDVFVVSGVGTSGIDNVNISGSYQASILTEQQVINLNEANLLNRMPSEASVLQQQLGFIEIPMEMEYKLLDKKVDINIVGGASTLLLNRNNLDIRTGNSTTTIGEANNLNDVSFSTNFALGFDYDITERFILNFEPTFKYQINTFRSGSTNFQPYFLGIYSGVVFKF